MENRLDEYEELVASGSFFERKAYKLLLSWKENHAPQKVACFLRGARRVGKTILSLELAHKEYRSFIRINCNELSEDIKYLFTNSLNDLQYFFSALQSYYKKTLYPRESIIIIDEVQLFPAARQALKTLCEDGTYDYLETGSLASITRANPKSGQKEHPLLLPSEEETIDVTPLDFEEFLLSMGDNETFKIIQSNYSSKRAFGPLKASIMKKFREYMLVGGMPKAVSEYRKSHDFAKVDFWKQSIISLYRGDMAYQTRESSGKIEAVFNLIPAELTSHEKTFKFSHINENARARDYGGALNWLEEAAIVNVAFNSKDPSPALALSEDDTTFKCYLLDTGLLVSLCYSDRPYLENDLYRDILLDKLHVNEGMIVENIVAQCLKSNGHKLFFYARYDKKSHRQTLEVDFEIRLHDKIVPIEVKSSDDYSHSSLDAFKKSFGNKIGEGIILYDGDYKHEDNVCYWPYFVASVL